MSKVYAKPSIGQFVRIAQGVEFSSLRADRPVDGPVSPVLWDRSDGFAAGTELEVIRLITFPQDGWKALLKHRDGRMTYMADWQVSEPEVFAIDELRSMVRAFESVNETFLQSFTMEELIAIGKAWVASEWDIYPDRWTANQVEAALKGEAPNWDSQERSLNKLDVAERYFQEGKDNS